MSNNNVPDSFTDADDMFADTRMSIGDHIEDLRSHLLRALKGFAIGMVLGLWPLGPWVLGIITAPVEQQLTEFQIRRFDRKLKEYNEKNPESSTSARPSDLIVEFDADQIKQMLEGKKVVLRPAQKEGGKVVKGFESLLYSLDAIRYLDKDAREQSRYVALNMRITDTRPLDREILKRRVEIEGKDVTTLEVTEAFMVYFKVSMFTGLVVSSPWVFYHIWMFIAAGLYPHEKRLVNVYLPFSLFLFIAGVLVCQFLVMPRAVSAMLWFNEWLGMSADMRLNEWLSFAIMMPVVFGVSFQTPLVMMFLHKVGIVTTEVYREYRKIAWFVMAVFAAIITPSVDALSMLFLWVPMGALYELGILLCVWQGEQNRLFEWEEEEKKTGELVEV
jgi:sec-independent protein translocase protein TatC